MLVHQRIDVGLGIKSPIQTKPRPAHAKLSCSSQERTNHEYIAGVARDVFKTHRQFTVGIPHSGDIQLRKRYVVLLRTFSQALDISGFDSVAQSDSRGASTEMALIIYSARLFR